MIEGGGLGEKGVEKHCTEDEEWEWYSSRPNWPVSDPELCMYVLVDEPGHPAGED